MTTLDEVPGWFSYVFLPVAMKEGLSEVYRLCQARLRAFVDVMWKEEVKASGAFT